jgi:hypothetical protein
MLRGMPSRTKTSLAMDPVLRAEAQKLGIDMALSLSDIVETALKDWLLYPHKGELLTRKYGDKIEPALRVVLPPSAATVGADLLAWFFSPAETARDFQVKLVLAGLFSDGRLRAFVEAQGAPDDKTRAATD